MAVTSSASSFTSAGTSALLAIALPFWRTSTPNASGYTSRPSGAGLLMYIARATHSTARPAADAIRKRRRPPFMRSSAGPSTGATITNGVMVIRRNSSTLPRAALVGLEKKIEPAIDTRMHASPHAPVAWA